MRREIDESQLPTPLLLQLALIFSSISISSIKSPDIFTLYLDQTVTCLTQKAQLYAFYMKP